MTLAVRSLGEDGERLNPRKANLEQWRQVFARLRGRGHRSRATLRRTRGIVRKPERIPVRKLFERHDAARRPVLGGGSSGHWRRRRRSRAVRASMTNTTSTPMGRASRRASPKPIGVVTRLCGTSIAPPGPAPQTWPRARPLQAKRLSKASAEAGRSQAICSHADQRAITPFASFSVRRAGWPPASL